MSSLFNVPAQNWVAVTPNDSTDVPRGRFRALYIGGAGAVSLIDPVSGSAVVFAAVPVGTVLHVEASRVRATGTTATNIVALY
jgi:hypothetical protein